MQYYKNHKNELFKKYHSIHGKNIEGDYIEKINFFEKYFEKYYKKYIPENDSVKILEIGCNKGYLLKILEDNGYKNLVGIDLSPEDLQFAKQNTSHAILYNIDAFEYCEKNQEVFDVIIIKAVLEHIEKDKIFNLIQLMKNALSENGVLIIDVPNMDWLFATHERYMDFTHEVGFTKESLSQVTLNFFPNIEVFTAGNIHSSFKRKILHIISKKIIGLLLKALDPQGYDTAWIDRNLIAICWK